MTRSTHFGAICVLIGAAALVVMPTATEALTTKECSAKYQAAKAAGTLQGMKWNDFRRTQCAEDSAATTAPAAPAPSAATRPAAPAAPPTASTPQRRAPSPPAAGPAAAGAPVFPTAVSPKYSNESEGKARMHTCLDQYNANKTTNSNGGLKWIQKGGGYYSECNKALKG
jgi:hypothetical protein